MASPWAAPPARSATVAQTRGAVALTDGGPGSLTEVTNYYSFLQAFNFSYLGFSSAITVVLLAATVALSWVIVRAVGWGVRVD